jgi:hypothetical protein
VEPRETQKDSFRVLFIRRSKNKSNDDNTTTITAATDTTTAATARALITSRIEHTVYLSHKRYFNQLDNMVSQRGAAILALVSLLSVARTTTAFTIAPQSSGAVIQRIQSSSTSRLFAESWDGTSSSGGGTGGIEQVEYKIFPDGRVEETVRGIKGNNCHKVTDQISSKLGEVVATSPTEEMYEQEVVLDQTVKQTEGGKSWEGDSTW